MPALLMRMSATPRFECVEGGDDGGFVDDVKHAGFGLMASGLEFIDSGVDRGGLTSVDDDFGAGIGKTFGDGESDSAYRTGDQCGASAQIE